SQTQTRRRQSDRFVRILSGLRGSQQRNLLQQQAELFTGYTERIYRNDRDGQGWKDGWRFRLRRPDDRQMGSDQEKITGADFQPDDAWQPSCHASFLFSPTSALLFENDLAADYRHHTRRLQNLRLSDLHYVG